VTERNPDTLYILYGANVRMAAEFCRDRGMPPTEIGRHVFPTSMDPDRLRGRRGPVEFVYGLDGDPSPFPLPYDPRRVEWAREAEFIQQIHLQAEAGR